MINTGGKTIYGFTGLTWRIPICKGFFEGEFGAVGTPRAARRADRVNTGFRGDFRELGGFGYQFDEHWDVIANVEHISHASLCTHINPGLTQVGARIGYRFWRGSNVYWGAIEDVMLTRVRLAGARIRRQ